MDKIPMTALGYERLEKELKNLKSVERPAVILAIAEARAHGDLSENAEYSAAREKQSFIEGRIMELEAVVSSDFEADLTQGRISTSAPIGRALIGKAAGTNVEVTTPKGLRYYEIVTVEYR
jgi:transcription elongation factor GreA